MQRPALIPAILISIWSSKPKEQYKMRERERDTEKMKDEKEKRLVLASPRNSRRAHPRWRMCEKTHIDLRSKILLFLGELLLPDVRAPQLDVQHSFHGAQHLLVGSGGAALKVLHDGDCGVALGGQVLLREFEALLVPSTFDGLADLDADGLGLDDVVASVDFGQVLAFDSACTTGLNRSEEQSTRAPDILDMG
jgi:hypothetical protein